MPKQISPKAAPNKGTRTSPKPQIDLTTQRLYQSTSVTKRGRAALEAQAFLRSTIRARLRRMYPNLSRREITFKYFEEVEKEG